MYTSDEEDPSKIDNARIKKSTSISQDDYIIHSSEYLLWCYAYKKMHTAVSMKILLQNIEKAKEEYLLKTK